MNRYFIKCLIMVLIAILNTNAYAFDHNNTSSIPDIRVLQTRNGDHGSFTRIVIDLNKKVDYRILKVSDTEYEVELFGYQRDDIENYYPKVNDHIDKIEYSKLENVVLAKIKLKIPSYVLKDFRLENTDRIVIDFSDMNSTYDIGIVNEVINEKKERYVKSDNIEDSISKESKSSESKSITEQSAGNTDDIKKIDVVVPTSEDRNDLDKANLKSVMEDTLINLTNVPSDIDTYKQNQPSDNKISYSKMNISDNDNIEFYFPLFENADKFRFQQFFTSKYSNLEFSNNIYELTINQHQVASTGSKEDEYFGKWGFSKLNFKPLFLDGLLTIEAEMAYNPENNLDFANYAIDGFQVYRNNMGRLYIQGEYSGFNYGAKYLYVNDRFGNVPGTNFSGDQQGGDIWIEKKLNIFSLRAFYSDYYDNVNKDPDKNRQSISKIGATFGIQPDHLPEFFITYSKGTSTKTRTGNSSIINKEDVDSLKAYLGYYINNWGLYLTGDYSKGVSVYDSDYTSKFIYYYLGGYYNPTENINISPSIGFGQEEYVWNGGSLNYLSPTVSLLLEYKSFYKKLDLSSHISYSKYFEPDGLHDINTIDTTAAIAWNNKKPKKIFDRVALEFSYLPYDYENDREFALLLNFRLKNL